MPRGRALPPESGGKKLLELRFRAGPSELKRVRNAVRRAATQAGCSEQGAEDVVLAVDEACQNIIRHAYGGPCDQEIVLEMERRDGDLLLSLLDFAPCIDEEKVRPRDLGELRPGGLGTHFIRELMDEVSFERPPSGRGNLLRMAKRIEQGGVDRSQT